MGQHISHQPSMGKKKEMNRELQKELENNKLNDSKHTRTGFLRVAQSWTRLKRLSTHTCTIIIPRTFFIELEQIILKVI